MERTALVHQFVQLYEAGDDSALLARCAAGVTVYGEPELAAAPIVRSRSELGAWLREWRGRPGGELRLENVVDRGDRVVADVIVDEGAGGGAWRLAVSAAFEGDLVSEIRLFWQRDTAIGV